MPNHLAGQPKYYFHLKGNAWQWQGSASADLGISRRSSLGGSDTPAGRPARRCCSIVKCLLIRLIIRGFPAGNHSVVLVCEASVLIISLWSVTPCFVAIFLKYGKIFSQKVHVSPFDMIFAQLVPHKRSHAHCLAAHLRIVCSRGLYSTVLSI